MSQPLFLAIDPPKEPGRYLAVDLRYPDSAETFVVVERHPNGALCIDGDPNRPVQVHPYLWAGPITRQKVAL